MILKENKDDFFIVKNNDILRIIPKKLVIFQSYILEAPNYHSVYRNYADCIQCSFVQKPDALFRTRYRCKLFGLNYGVQGMVCDLFHDNELKHDVSYYSCDDFVIIYKRYNDEPEKSKLAKFLKKIIGKKE